MNFFTRQKWMLLVAVVVMVIAAPAVSYAQSGGQKDKAKAKAIEKLSNRVMKDIEKKFTEVVAKTSLPTSARANTVKILSEMSRPVMNKYIEGAASGKLPKPAELSKMVLNDILPQVPDIVAAVLTEGSGGTAGDSAQAIAAVAPVAGKAGSVQTRKEDSRFFISTNAQDLILLKNKNIIMVTRVTDISPAKISYLNYGGQPTSISVDDVLSVKYKDGTVKIVNE